MSKMNWNKVREQNRASRYGLEIDFSVGADPNKLPPNYTPPQSSGIGTTIILHGRLESQAQSSSSKTVITRKSSENQRTSKLDSTEPSDVDPIHKLHQCPFCNKRLPSNSIKYHIDSNHKKLVDKSKVKFNERAIVIDWENIVKPAVKNKSITLVKCTKCDAMLNSKNVQRHMRKVHSVISDIGHEASK